MRDGCYSLQSLYRSLHGLRDPESTWSRDGVIRSEGITSWGWTGCNMTSAVQCALQSCTPRMRWMRSWSVMYRTATWTITNGVMIGASWSVPSWSLCIISARIKLYKMYKIPIFCMHTNISLCGFFACCSTQNDEIWMQYMSDYMLLTVEGCKDKQSILGQMTCRCPSWWPVRMRWANCQNCRSNL